MNMSIKNKLDLFHEKEELIDKLRQQQSVTRGASDWMMIEEEIQSLLNVIELRKCFDEEE